LLRQTYSLDKVILSAFFSVGKKSGKLVQKALAAVALTVVSPVLFLFSPNRKERTYVTFDIPLFVRNLARSS
jgi:hypothetical protein